MSCCLVLFSGGKDSFIATCRIIDRGYTACMFITNSGCVIGDENAVAMSKRIIRRYGEDKAILSGVRSTVATRMRIDREWKSCSTTELVRSYASVTGVQAQCFFCQTSMWLDAIAYCKAHFIDAIACGYKETDEFCTGSQEYLQFISNIARDYGINVHTPMWDFKQPKDAVDMRDQAMLLRGFVPQVLEPKCTVGLPVSSKITESEVEQLIDYINEYVDYKNIIAANAKSMQFWDLTEEALSSIAAWESPDNGLF